MNLHSSALYQALEEDLHENYSYNPLPFHAKYLLEECYSKLIIAEKDTADTVALDKFLASNDRCRSYTVSPSTIFHDLLLAELRRDLHSLKSPDIPLTIGFGPGSCHGSKNTSLTSKLDGSWTSTSRWVYGVFVQSVKDSPGFMALANSANRLKIVQGSKLCFVPKKESESRVIACEPLLNMACQKSYEGYLKEWLKSNFQIDLSTQQDWNRLAARIGSEDGSYVTIDLSSASDTVSIALCESILPSDVFETLMAFRSPRILLPCGTWLDLHMISSMGNATTFPLETIIFAATVRAVYKILGLSAPFDYCCFGDDIIVVSSAARLVIEALTFLGFVVNTKKTFLYGSFRESCGGDYLHGKNVRPVYIRSLTTVVDLCSALNRLVCWSARHNEYLPRSVELLTAAIQAEGGAPLIPLDENVDAGVFSYNFKGFGRYKALRPIPRYDLNNYSENALLLTFLQGALRDGNIGTRSFSRPRYRWVNSNTPCWNRVVRSTEQFENSHKEDYGFTVASLFEDLPPAHYHHWLILYNLVV